MLNKLTVVIQKFSPELRKIISNIGWLFADRVLRMGVGLIVTAWIARYLGPQQFGLFNYAVAFVSLFGVLATLGLDQIVVRDLVRDPSCKDETLGTAFVLKLSGGILTILVTTGTILLLRPDDQLTHWLVGITVAGTIFDAFNTIDFWFQLQVKSKYTVIAKNTAFILVTLIRIALLQMQAPLIAFAWALLAENALGAVGLAIAYKVKGQSLLAWRPSLLRAKTLLKESWPLILSGLAIMVYLRIDQIMLGQLADDKAVGIYSAATKISELWYYIPIAIVTSVTPSIVEAKKVSEELYYNKLQKLFNLMAILAYMIAIPMTFLSKYIVVIIFGQNYVASGGVLAIHIWAALFVFFGWSKGIWIVAEGLTMFSLIATTSGAVMNILLNFWLLPIYRETGAAIATVISYAFVDYFMCLIYPPTRSIGWVMTKAMTLSFFTGKNLFR
jgi:PST family polysaccharide transporter